MITVPMYNMEVTSFGVTAELGFRRRSRPAVVGQRTSRGSGSDGHHARDRKTSGNRITCRSRSGVSRPPTNTTRTRRDMRTIRKKWKGYVQTRMVGRGSGHPRSSRTCRTRRAADRTSHDEVGLVGGTRELVRSDVETPSIVECERVPFNPSIEVQPTTRSAESPTGLDVSLVVPQSWENPDTIATANLKDTRLTLPEGLHGQPVGGLGSGGVHAGAVRVGNVLVAAG